MKKILLVFAFSFLILGANAQEKFLDSLAIKVLDRMSDLIGELKSCTFVVNTAYDSLDIDLGFIIHHNTNKVYFSGPEKLLVMSEGDKGKIGFYYNGDEMIFYSYTNNHYGYFDAPRGNTMEAIDAVHNKYNIDFPAADFFYPTFTDDLIAQADRIEYLGKRDVNGVNCFYVVARNKDTNIQLWIKNDAFNLPVKMLIVNQEKGKYRLFEATFSEWAINPEIPDAIFNFSPPATARKIYILPAY